MVIADDHAPTREDVRYAIEQDPRFEVVAEAADAPGAIDAAVRKIPALCLLDVHMPGSGISAVWEISARLPQTKIVMLTVSREDRDLLAALKAGAAGYLLKDMDPRKIPDVLGRIIEGQISIPRELLGSVVEDLRDRRPRRRALASDAAGDEAADKLTSREWQVLDLTRQGMTTAQIARRLIVSPVTVRTHVNAAMRKLGVNSREELRERFPER